MHKKKAVNGVSVFKSYRLEVMFCTPPSTKIFNRGPILENNAKQFIQQKCSTYDYTKCQFMAIFLRHSRHAS